MQMMELDNSIKVFVCSHINAEIIDDPMYELLHTGQAYDKTSFEGVRGDDTGDNISDKKGTYDGLLTGMYWIWKNTDYKYTGMCTYRAYMGVNNKPLSSKETQDLFDDGYDLIVARGEFANTTEKHFRLCHPGFFYNHLHDPLVYTERVLKKYYPEMVETYHYCLSHSTMNYKITYIARRTLFDNYSEWVFEFIEHFLEYAKEVDYPIGPRFFGYLIERLERVWIMTNRVNVIELPVVFVSDIDSTILWK